jgi:hypothetical protein
MTLAAAVKAKAKDHPMVLTIDIETSPHLAWTFSTFKTTISPDMIVEPSRILCFAAKWRHEKRIRFHSEHHDGRDEMIRQAHALLDAADIVVTYNGPGFDEKHLRRTFILAGLGPPSPWQSVDLLRTSRGQFKFPSNRLGAVGQSLGIGAKVETGGWRLWQDVLAGDERAWAKFRRYCMGDVRLTESLLDTYGPWIPGLPHAGLWSGNVASCYACGSTDLEPHGISYTKSMAYPRLRCRCGAWNRVLRNGRTRAA